MSTDANKEPVRRFYAAVDAGDTAVVPELFDGEWQNVDPSLPPMRGLDGARELVGMFTASFPDFTSRIALSPPRTSGSPCGPATPAPTRAISWVCRRPADRSW